MSAPVKFLFEDDFTSGHLGAAKRMISATAHEAAVARAEAEGHRRGMAAAEAQIAGRAIVASIAFMRTTSALTIEPTACLTSST